MKQKAFSDKDLRVIREIAISIYLDADPDGKVPSEFQLQVIAEATLKFLKHLSKIKDET